MSLSIITGNINLALTASSTKTHLRVTAGGGRPARLLKAVASFNGITAVDPPVLVQLCRYSGDGTMTSLTALAHDLARDEAQAATWGHTATVEPTGAVVLDAQYVHPQGGSYTWNFADRREIVVPGTNGSSLTRMGLRFIVGTLTATTNVQCSMTIEE